MQYDKIVFLILSILISAKLYGQRVLSVQSLPKLQRRLETESLSAEEKRQIKFDCENIKTDLTFAPLTKDGKQGILHIASRATCDTQIILIFEQLNSRWNLMSRSEIHSWHNHPVRISFQSLIEKNIDEMIIEHEETDTGTGSLQFSMVIYKWIDKSFQVVFDEPQEVKYDQPNGNSRYKIEQQSTFEIIGADRKHIVEKRVTQQNDGSIKRWLLWEWANDIQRFRSTECSPECE